MHVGPDRRYLQRDLGSCTQITSKRSTKTLINVHHSRSRWLHLSTILRHLHTESEHGRPKARLCAEEKSTVYSLRIKRWRYFNCTRYMYCHFVNRPKLITHARARIDVNKTRKCMINIDTHLFYLSTRTEASKGMQHRMIYWPKKRSYPCRSNRI